MNSWALFLRQEIVSKSQIDEILQDIFPFSSASESTNPLTVFASVGISVEKRQEGYICVDALFESRTLSALSGASVHYIPECTSSNTIAREYALQDNSKVNNKTEVVVTDFQTEGRGRLQRNWYSNNAENLLFSVILRPNISAEIAPRCSLLWAAAIAQEMGFMVKWPNDIFTEEGRKIAGVLCEASFERNRVEYLIAGIGLNIHQTDFPKDTYASSLDLEWDIENNRSLIFARIVRTIIECDVTQNMELHRKRSYVLGKVVQVGNIKGKATLIHEDGTLIIDGKAVCTGDVQVLNEI